MSDKRKFVFGVGAVVAVILLLLFLIMGPAGIKNHFNSWRANAYGSDWLVIQYTGMGEVQNHWELKGSAIHNESQSDGIYFTTDHGVVHLSGHYIYIQNPTPEAKEAYLTRKPQPVERKK